jgi:predicted ferric reductase
MLLSHLIEHESRVLAAASAEASPLLWYLTRATAVSAYVVLSLSAMLGMLRGVARNSGERLSWITDELHQTLATVFFGLVLLHLITLIYDPFLPFSIANILLPVNEPYQPFGVDLGVLALYTLVIVLFSSWIRRAIPYRYWRGLHYASFGTFVLVTLHGLLAGSDASQPWMRAIYAGAGGAVGFLALIRWLTSRKRPVEAVEPDEDGGPDEEAWVEIEEEPIREALPARNDLQGTGRLLIIPPSRRALPPPKR